MFCASIYVTLTIVSRRYIVSSITLQCISVIFSAIVDEIFWRMVMYKKGKRPGKMGGKGTKLNKSAMTIAGIRAGGAKPGYPPK